MGFVSISFPSSVSPSYDWSRILWMWPGWIFANDVAQFETVEWSLTPEGGETVSLLDGSDPFQKEE